MSIQHIDIDANGMQFDALASGPAGGELVLLLHGFPQSKEIWRPALRAIGDAGYRAVAVNQRGYALNASPQEVDGYRIEELVEDVLGIASGLGHTRMHLIGHDWGGTVAWAVATAHPEWLASVTSISTPHTAALRDALRGREQRMRMLYVPVLRLPIVPETVATMLDGRLLASLLVRSGLSPAHARRDAAALRDVGATGPLNWYRALGRSTFSHAGPVTVPTLYVWSDGDVAFSRAAAEGTEAHVTGPYHFVELQGASHWIPDQNWSDIEDLVLEHLSTAGA